MFIRYKNRLYRSLRLAAVDKRKLFSIGTFDIYRVDGSEIRDRYEPDFTNWGQPLQFPDLVPPHEIWLDVEAAGSELPFFVDRALAEYRLMAQGYSYSDAVTMTAARERRERRKMRTKLDVDAYQHNSDDVKRKLLLTTSDGIKVWLVDGNAVRTYYDVDFTEGGHDLVYDYIPAQEIWLDDDLVVDERPVVLAHEKAERGMMQRGWSYDEAHLAALDVEQALR